MTIQEVTIPIISSKELKEQYFTVLSVELGNTTIKSIILTTNIKTNKNYQLNKVVRLTRDIRLPRNDEEIFGHTIWNKPLSKEAIEEAVMDIILDSLSEINMSVSDLDFAVRSTGIVAISSLSKELGSIIKALSNGCLSAGIKPSQMTAPFSINNIPKHIRKFSFFNNIPFDGSIVSVASPKVTGRVANEMEGELVTAGIKLAAKSSIIDYRNPVISIDMGTTLAGQVIDNSKPYANVLCNYVGLAGGISDVILRGCNIIDTNHSTIDVGNYESNVQYNMKNIHNNTIKLHEFIDIMKVPSNVNEFGLVTIDSKLVKQSNIGLIGCQINNEKKLINTFNKIIQNYQINEIQFQIDDLYAYMIKRLIDETIKLNILPQNTTLGITGRAGITGKKPELIEKYISTQVNDIIFTSDGLALGALMVARCMNSLGTPINPVGGSRKGMCIMQERISINKKEK
ncbi:methanogenesis marker 14 protein [Methanosphaera sp. WGK6]|uniref:methanogenesis marker 14 protein n=1 Tax=Methanosphaera sp. WGK6 TaxID=1561964 RepID=UPI00084C81B3|nr:methanogenesis marker 14 protein [Methanosphaera sp. WGK6]